MNLSLLYKVSRAQPADSRPPVCFVSHRSSHTGLGNGNMTDFLAVGAREWYDEGSTLNIQVFCLQPGFLISFRVDHCLLCQQFQYLIFISYDSAVFTSNF